MNSINMNGIKIGNMSGVNAVNAPVNQPEIKNEVENTSEDTQKPAVEQAQKPEAKPQVKHVITYIGSSEYKDSTGHKWSKNHEQTYSEDEYANRKDLHFMVGYGEMKHIAVTM